MTTAAEIREALRLRFPSNSHALLWEVATSTGAGADRFADAVAVGLWPSHGFMVDGIEIKVTRADFAKEMASPEKSQAIMRYCHRWWLAAPKGMVKPDELPPTWGLLELNGDGVLRQRVAAPKLKPEAMTMGFIASLLRRSAGRDETMTQHAVDRLVKAAVDRDEARRVQEAESAAERVHARHNASAAVLERLEAQGIDVGRIRDACHGDQARIQAAVELAIILSGAESWNGVLRGLRDAQVRLEETTDLIQRLASARLPRQPVESHHAEETDHSSIQGPSDPSTWATGRPIQAGETFRTTEGETAIASGEVVSIEPPPGATVAADGTWTQ